MVRRRDRDLQLFHRICETLIFAFDGGSSACQQEKWSEWSHTKLSHSFRTQKAHFANTQKKLSWSKITFWVEIFFFVFFISQLGISRQRGLWRQDSGRAWHPHQESPHQVWRPRLFSHPEEYSAKDAEEGHLAVAGGQDPHRQPETVAHLQIRLQKKSQRGFLHTLNSVTETNPNYMIFKIVTIMIFFRSTWL